MKIIGHRGARGLAPENTVAGLAKALQHHVDGLEIDVRVTKDAVPILAHNADITDAGGEKLTVRDHTYEELKAHKPDLATLAEAIAHVNRRVPIVIEIKPGEPTAQTIAVIREFVAKGWLPADLPFVSFDFRILQTLHTAFPDHEMIVDEMWSGVRATWRARRLGSKSISLYTPFIWSGFVRAVARRGYKLYAFPMNHPAKARRWAKLGFYGVITDYPDRFEK